MPEYIRLMRRWRGLEGLGAFTVSLVFHALLLHVFAALPAYQAALGAVASFEVLWFWSATPSSQPSDTKGRPPVPSSRPDPAPDGEGRKTTAEPSGEKRQASSVVMSANDDSRSVTEIAELHSSPVEWVTPVPLIQEPTAQGAGYALQAVPEGTLMRSRGQPDVHRVEVKAGAYAAAVAWEYDPRRDLASAGSTSQLAAGKQPVETSAVRAEGANGREALKEQGNPSGELDPQHKPVVVQGPKSAPSVAEDRIRVPLNQPDPRLQESARGQAVPLDHQVVLEKTIKRPAMLPGSHAAPVAQAKADLAGSTHKVNRFEPSPAPDLLPSLHGHPSTEKAEPVQPIQPAQNDPGPRGLVFPEVRGDLVFTVVGGAGIEISILFREYSRARRTKGVTNAELRRAYKLTPKMVRTKEQERQAVIEKTSEGVYILAAETQGGRRSEAAFTLELSGLQSNRRITPLGSRSVSGRCVIGKVLMPEGLLWDDDNAFTGSIVDSESTTKFNESKGLIWKEYAD